MTTDQASPTPDRSGDDWIEAALRDASVSSEYIDDAGFTARVMATLPPELEAVPAWRKPAVAVMWAVAAAGACVALPQFAIDVGREAFGLLAAHRVSLPQIGVALALLGFSTWSAAAYALRND